MKDVTLTIVGTRYEGGREEGETIEFVTDGKLYQHGRTIYLVYDESELSGMKDCRTRLTLRGDTVRMTRRGRAVGIDTEIFFEKGTRYSGYYDTEYGPIEMEVLTNDLSNTVTADEEGSVEIDYSISLKGLAEGRNKLSIQVRDAS